MEIKVDTYMMQINIWDKGELISRLDFGLCDDEMLKDNAKEIEDLLIHLNKKYSKTIK